MSSVRVAAPGLLTSVQDLGRRGYEHLGIMLGGVADDFAASWANRLVGNRADAALLEVTMLGPTLEVLEDGLLSLTGADLGARVDGTPWQPGTARHLPAGTMVRFGGARRGARAYIGFHGGIDVPAVLGSSSTDLTAGFGGFQGRPLRSGDVLHFADGTGPELRASVDTLLARSAIRILPGVRLDRFPGGTIEEFVMHEYTVSPYSDRVGLRLAGHPVGAAPARGNGVSEGMAVGSVQLPPGGEPLVLLKSRGTIGGYPTLAHVIRADIPALAQLAPGDTVRVELVGRDEAVEALRRLHDLMGAPAAPSEQMHAAADVPPVPPTVVKAPSWCTVYRARNPGHPPLVQPGQRVRAGETLAVIEVMKSFSDLISPHDGTVVAMHFEDGELVQEGQVLIEMARD